eukprot:3786270-Prymnesium_polylepis.1
MIIASSRSPSFDASSTTAAADEANAAAPGDAASSASGDTECAEAAPAEASAEDAEGNNTSSAVAADVDDLVESAGSGSAGSTIGEPGSARPFVRDEWEAVEADDGRVYYWNLVTDEVSWSFPPAASDCSSHRSSLDSSNDPEPIAQEIVALVRNGSLLVSEPQPDEGTVAMNSYKAWSYLPGLPAAALACLLYTSDAADDM